MTDENLNVMIGGGGIGKRNSPMQARLRNGKPQCQGLAYRRIGRFGEWGQCSRAGTTLAEATEDARGSEAGKRYYFCGTHAPLSKSLREESSRERYRLESEKNQRKWARGDAVNEILKALRARDFDAVMEAFSRHEANMDASG